MSRSDFVSDPQAGFEEFVRKAYGDKAKARKVGAYAEWHMRDALREFIFDDDDIAAAQASRKSVVAPARRSESAKQKDATRRTPEGASGAELPGSAEGHGDAHSQQHPLRIECV